MGHQVIMTSQIYDLYALIPLLNKQALKPPQFIAGRVNQQYSLIRFVDRFQFTSSASTGPLKHFASFVDLTLRILGVRGSKAPI